MDFFSNSRAEVKNTAAASVTLFVLAQSAQQRSSTTGPVMMVWTQS